MASEIDQMCDVCRIYQMVCDDSSIFLFSPIVMRVHYYILKEKNRRIDR